MKHIVYTKTGMWKFYYDAHLGICFYEPQQLTPMILFDKGLDDFSVICNGKSEIFLLCQDDKNSIWLFVFDRKKWTRRCIFESKTIMPYPKSFQLICINDWISAFYTIKHQNKHMLVHHILNAEENPDIIEQSDSPIIFTVTKDLNQNIHCLYLKDNLVEKVFTWSSKSWGCSSPFAEISGDILNISAITDSDNELHFTYSARYKNDYSVCYGNKSGIQELIFGVSVNPKPVIFYDKEFYILFRMGGRLLKTSSGSPDNGFFKPSYYFPGSFSNHDIFRVSTPIPLSEFGIYVNEIYGTELRPDRFEAAIIGNTLNEIDFKLPTSPKEQPFDIEKFVDNSAPFEKSPE